MAFIDSTSGTSFAIIGINPDVLGQAIALQTGAFLGGIDPALLAAALDRGPAVVPPFGAGAVTISDEERDKLIFSDAPLIDFDDPRIQQFGGNEGFKELFALYIALSRMKDLADYANRDTVIAPQLAGFDRRFQDYLTELLPFIEEIEVEGLDILAGKNAPSTQARAVFPRAILPEFTGGVAHIGAREDPLTTITGNEVFTAQIDKTDGTAVTATFDLSQMGATARTIDNIVAFLNGELETAGVTTRFAVEEFDDTHFGFIVKGALSEKVTLSAPVTEPAIYVAGRSGKGEDEHGVVTKFDDLASGEPNRAFEARIDPETGSAKVENVAVDSQGFVYAVGTTTGDLESQFVQGARDVYLSKFDAAGNLIYRRLLGASDKADGFAIAIDGEDNVIVAGQVDAQLTALPDGFGFDTFVTKFDPEGEEVFTYQNHPGPADGGLDLAVDAAGNVFVSGYTLGRISANETHLGASDGFVFRLSASGVREEVLQFGTAGDDRAEGVAIADDGNLLVLSREDGRGILRKYDPANLAGGPIFTLDLGDLGVGDVADIKADATGIYITGHTDNAALTGGTGAIVDANSGGVDAFLTKVADSGATASVSFTTYLGTAADDRAAGLTLLGGDVYVTGRTQGALPGETLLGTTDSFLARFDTAGARLFVRQFPGRESLGGGVAIAGDAAGTSAVTKLGLPHGEIPGVPTNDVTEQTSVRLNQKFTLTVNGDRARTVTLRADESISRFADRLNIMLGVDGTARATTTSQGRQLVIEAKNGATIEIGHGPEGFDALPGLGLAAETLIAREPKAGASEETADGPERVGLDILDNLNLLTKADVERTTSALDSALRRIRTGFRNLTAPETEPDPLAGVGPPPPHIAAQIANYQAALARLSGPAPILF